MRSFQLRNWQTHPKLWRFMGFISSLLGLLSYALSSSFKHLFGEWNFFKITTYVLVSSIISSIMLFASKWKLSRSFLLKLHLGFLILMLTTLYSFFYDQTIKGKADLWTLISCAAFSVMSLSLSKQTNLGFEVDLLNFFLGCLTIQLMKINLMLGFLAAIFCYFLIVLRSNSNPQLEIGAIRDEDHVEVEVIETVVIGDGARNHQNQTLRRRFDDGYNWKKYEEKQVKGSGNYTSYYKCTNPNCSVKKRIERCVDGKGSEVIYKGTHNHCKPKHASLNRNSSFETLPAIHPSKMVPIEIPYQQLDSVDTPDNSSVSISDGC